MPDEELIEELSEMGGHPRRAHLPMGETLRQAADRLKALKAEVERLASVATDGLRLQPPRAALEKQP
jgi:hypothetical protein